MNGGKLNVTKKMSFQLKTLLKTLIQELIKPESLKKDIFVALLLEEMKDNGFQQLKAAGKAHITTKDYIFSQNRRQDNLYEAVFIFNRYQEFPVKLIVCFLKEIALINATMNYLSEDVHSVCFEVDKYVVTSDFGVPYTVSNLDELFTIFKDKIVTPIKSLVLNYNKSPSGNLSGLPEDVIHQIALILPLRDVISMSETCVKMSFALKMDRLWAQLCKRDFPTLDSKDCSWYSLYKDTYMDSREPRVVFSGTVVEDESFGELAGLSDYVRYTSNSRWEVIW